MSQSQSATFTSQATARHLTLSNLMVGGLTTLWGKPALWSVDRWGRLLAGSSTFALTLLAVYHHPMWLAGIAVLSLNLVVTALTNRCALHDLLMKLGAQEREQLFNADGSERQAS